MDKQKLKKMLYAAFVLAAAVAPAGEDAASRVVLIGVDGLGASYVPWDKMPNLSKLREKGLYAASRCHRPTASAINWATICTGLPPELHGYSKWNSKKPEIPPFKPVLESGLSLDLFRLIREQRPDAATGSFFEWDGIGFIHDTNSATVAKHIPPAAGTYEARDAQATSDAISFIKEKKPLLTFLYLGEVDEAGHENGWGSEQYTNACAAVDANIGRVVAALDETGLLPGTAIMLVADHGGKGKDHGGIEDIVVFETPFVASGTPLEGMRLREPLMLMDVTPTILSVLGLDIPETMRGRPALAKQQ